MQGIQRRLPPCWRSPCNWLSRRRLASTIAYDSQSNYPIEEAALTEHQIGQLKCYMHELLEVNEQMNMTSVRDPEEAWQRHVCDSLALLPVIDAHLASSLKPKRGSEANDELCVIDVGTGPGLPGVILAVARPLWRFTLLDSMRKRCDFMEATTSKMNLTNVKVIWSRAEDAGQDLKLRESYDLALARAVAEARVLAELCLPFVRNGGIWIAAKGPNPQIEVEASKPSIKKLGGELLGIELVKSWSTEGQRTALVVRKEGKTPLKFPRKPGTPNSSPL